jgi:hypothetical protein
VTVVEETMKGLVLFASSIPRQASFEAKQGTHWAYERLPPKRCPMVESGSDRQRE